LRRAQKGILLEEKQFYIQVEGCTLPETVQYRIYKYARISSKENNEKRCMTAIEWWNEHTRAVLRYVAGRRDGAFRTQLHSSPYRDTATWQKFVPICKELR
jgi:hypothetical protein